jgi:restriction system protein
MCIPIALFAYFVVSGLIGGIALSDRRLAGFAGLGPLAGGGLAVIILLAGLKAFVERRSRERILANQTGIASIRGLSWPQFELLVGQICRHKGYDVIEKGGNGPDGGVDLKARRNGATSLIQCKHWKSWKVGVSIVRELYGVMTAERAAAGVIVTSGVFSKEAMAFAQGKPIDLIDGDALCRLVQEVRGTSNEHWVQDPVPSEPSAPSEPMCPECRSGMILRTAKRGANAGSEFWGCSRYPKCKGIRQCVNLHAPA